MEIERRVATFRPRGEVVLPILLCLVVLLSGCAQAKTPSPFAISQPSPTSAATSAHTYTPTVPPSNTPSPSPTPPPATPTPVFAICSPLEGVSLAEIGQPDLLKNPFLPPRPGMDDGHFGADFAYWSRGDRKTMLGLPVYSVFAGRVAGVIHNHQPYGNAVIVETPLTGIPVGWLPVFPTAAPTVQPASSLYCPPDPVNYANRPGRSLYLLYAHFNKTPLLTVDQPVTCGQAIGEVGTTGKSVNPHLHLETRVGPAGATFPEMAHYENSATDSEMRTYCTWRVSGLFQAFDPLSVLSLQP